MNFSGKKIFVTGGTRGIGQSIVNRFIIGGGEVVYTGTNYLASKLTANATFLKFDFTNTGDIDDCANEIKIFGPDILVNNAGINIICPFEDISPSDYLKIQQVNAYAPMRLMQASISGMKNRKWGRIVNITSIFGIRSKSMRASYSASKFALDGLTVALAAEYAEDGILANSIAPGFINTDLTRGVLGESGVKKISSSIPIGRLGKPEEVANLVCWLASNQNTYITGQNIVIDGGVNRVHC